MTDIEHAKKYAEESISLAISMYNPKAEIIAETACLYGLTYKNKQIKELEEQIEKMNCNDCCYNLPRDGHPYCTYEDGKCIKISILEKENAELDCQKNRNKFCYSCANATERCYRKEIGCPCGKYKSYKEENSKLKDRCANYEIKIYKMKKGTCDACRETEKDKRLEEIEKENEKLKRGYHYEAEVINGKPTGKAILVPDNLAYVKSIVKDLLDNSDEYAKQRAREFLEEKLK